MVEKESKDITKTVSSEILNKTIDLSIDYAELGMDDFLENGILKDIPFFKSALVFYNITNSIIDRHKVKKILSFFKEFHSKTIDETKLNSFKEKFKNDSKYQKKVVELIILSNERFLQIEKSKILANLIKAHIEESLTWKELQDISYVLDMIHPLGFDFLRKMSKEERWNNHGQEKDGEALMFACGVGHRYGTSFSIQPLGQKLFNYGIKPFTENNEQSE